MAAPTPSKPGIAMIVVNTNFEFAKLDWLSDKEASKDPAKDPTRYGAKEDAQNLVYVFETKLKMQLFGEKIHDNVHMEEYNNNPFWIHNESTRTCSCLTCLIRKADYTDSECFLLAISSHGVRHDGEQEVCMSDEASADRLKLSDIIKALSDDQCPSLIGKPRILILTVCRADPEDPEDRTWDKGQTVDEKDVDFARLNISDQRNANTDEQTGSPPVGDMQENNNQTGANGTRTDVPVCPSSNVLNNSSQPRHHTDVFDDDTLYLEKLYGVEKALQDLPNDFLVVFPTYKGLKSVHNNRTGSWLIEELRKAVEEHDFAREPKMNFLKILTKVSGKVALKKGERGQKTAVTIYHRLRKPLIFQQVPATELQNPQLPLPEI